jgi:hypothetical protein
MRPAWLREDLFVTRLPTSARNALHGDENMLQHDVWTRIGRVRTPQWWYESRLLLPVCVTEVSLWWQQCWSKPHFSCNPTSRSLQDWGRMTVVATTRDPRDHDRCNFRDNACLTTPVQPDYNVLQHHRAETSSVVVCATKHPPTIEIYIYGEIAGTGDP